MMTGQTAAPCAALALKAGLAAALLTAACAAPTLAAPVKEEEAIDSRLGLLNRPWRVNVVRLRTRDYLRLRAQVKTGRQSYDQQVERAQEISPELYKTVTESESVKPAGPAPEPPPEVEPPDNGGGVGGEVYPVIPFKVRSQGAKAQAPAR